jgi:hypothetical protein
MLAMGWLQPGWSGTCPLADGSEITAIDLRVTAKQLYFSWRFAGEGPGEEGSEGYVFQKILVHFDSPNLRPVRFQHSRGPEPIAHRLDRYR